MGSNSSSNVLLTVPRGTIEQQANDNLDTRRGRYAKEGIAMVVLGKWNLSRLDSKAQEEGLSRSAMLRRIIEEHFDEQGK